jgi:predicted transcriptional regulator
MQRPSLGDQEFALLRYVAEQGAVTVGEVAAGFGEPQGLARSTVVTVMERLRKKGYLTRKKHDGVFRYVSPLAKEEILGGLVHQFVEKTLAGSLVPFLTYFSQRRRLSAEELTALHQLVEKLQTQDKEANS